MSETMITMPIDRYAELLDIETRVDVLVDMLKKDKCMQIPDILTILGHKREAKELAERKENKLTTFEEVLESEAND